MTATLCSSDLLKIEVNRERGISRLGKINESVQKSLRSLASATLSEAPMHLTDSFPPSAKNSAFHPMQERHLGETVMWWVNAKELIDDGVMKAIDALTGKDAFQWISEVNFFTCDYMGLHDDRHLHSSFCSGVVLLLLSAPDGCNLVTKGKYMTSLEPGDLIWFDDTEDHGAFPKACNGVQYVNLETTVGRKDFLEKHGMTFMLMTCEIPIGIQQAA